MGSSHGDSRITRQAIGEGVEYTPLALRSYEIIRELEDKTAHRLLLTCGGPMISNKEGQGMHHVQNFFDTTVTAATKHQIKYEILDAIDIKRRFPAFKVAAHEYVYYEPEAGILYPEQCISAQIDVAKSMGAEVYTGEEVLSYQETPDGVIVKTTIGEYNTRQLIITAGPWLPELLKEQSGVSSASELSNSSKLGSSNQMSKLSTYFKIVRQVMYWCDIKEQYQNFKPGHFPIFIWEG